MTVPLVETPDSAVTALPSVLPVLDGTATGVDMPGTVAMAPSPVVPVIPESGIQTGDLLPAVPDPGAGIEPATALAGGSQLTIGDVFDDASNTWPSPA